jgi:hypothetical protein
LVSTPIGFELYWNYILQIILVDLNLTHWTELLIFFKLICVTFYLPNWYACINYVTHIRVYNYQKRSCQKKEIYQKIFYFATLHIFLNGKKLYIYIYIYIYGEKIQMILYPYFEIKYKDHLTHYLALLWIFQNTLVFGYIKKYSINFFYNVQY